MNLSAVTRRALFLIPLAACVAADPSQEVLDMITGTAASLSAGDARAFLADFDPAMPGYSKLRDNVTGLLAHATVESFVDVASNEGDAQSRNVELTWSMRIKHTGDATAAPPREQRIKCRVQKQGRKWRFIAFDPVDFFAP